MYGSGGGYNGGGHGGYTPPPQNPWAGGYAPKPPFLRGERREPGLVLVFSFLTCGLYYLYWVYRTSEETQVYLGEEDTSPAIEVLLHLCTCGIYNIYWDYKQAKKLARMLGSVGLPATDNALLYVAFDVLGHGMGLGLINVLIQQGHLNDVWLRAGQANPAYRP